MSFGSSLNPDVVKTLLDDVFMTKYSIEKFPGRATAETAAIFAQDTASSSAVIMDMFGGAGEWTSISEEQNLPEGTPRIKNTKTFTMAKFAQHIKIPKEFFDDQMHGSYEKMVQSFARRAMTSRDKNAFGYYRNAFTTSLTSDSVALFSNSHVAVNGGTVDNLASGALSETTLNTAINQMAEMKAQDGEIDGHTAATLLVPMALFKLACEIVDSELRSGTANNDLNYYSKKFPGLQVYTSPYLGAAAGGSETAWFLLSTEQPVTRWVREAVNTNLVNYDVSSNDVYVYKGRFRETVGAMTYEGAVASTGV